MKAIFIALIVTGFLVPLLIGGGYKISELLEKTRSCSTITCGDNERCQEFDDHIFSCECLKTAYRNQTTDKCDTKYKWVKYESEMINDTRLVEFHKNSGDVHGLGRLDYGNGDILPCDVEIKFDKPNPVDFLNNLDPKMIKFEVLMIDSGEAVWIKSSNGIIENDAIEGGKKKNETIYICRVYDGKNYSTGWMQPSKLACCVPEKAQHYYPYKNYELLIYTNSTIIHPKKKSSKSTHDTDFTQIVLMQV